MCSEKKMDLNARCLICNKMTTIKDVDMAGYKLWSEDKVLIQSALPDLSVDDRELLISGTCKTCWDSMFENDNMANSGYYGESQDDSQAW